MKFIDLYAGLGGFHVALRRLGHTCVFASEIEPDLQTLYKKNFRLEAQGDIRAVPISKIPGHDILCAGFPCQPFSKAGSQQGLECPRYGDLFDYVIDILHARKPKFLILENVPNLSRHDSGRTWSKMSNRLRRAGYAIREHRFSPHQFGIPQVRDRIYIVGCRDGLRTFDWPVETPPPARLSGINITATTNNICIRCRKESDGLPNYVGRITPHNNHPLQMGVE